MRVQSRPPSLCRATTDDGTTKQGALFYNFSIDAHVPADHLVRSIDRFVDLSELRHDLAPFYSSMGRPSVDPELMIRMLIVGYCFEMRYKSQAI